MNEKERIIELVKQNVITMDEALHLLEAAANQTQTKNAQKAEATEKEAFGTDLKNTVQDIVDSSLKFSQEVIENVRQATRPVKDEVVVDDEEINEMEQEIATLESELKPKKESLLIATQRLRELEILAELDELNDELEEQQRELINEVAQLNAEVSGLTDQVNNLKRAINVQRGNDASTKSDYESGKSDAVTEKVERKFQKAERKLEKAERKAARKIEQAERKVKQAERKIEQAGRKVEEKFEKNIGPEISSAAHGLGRFISSVVGGALNMARENIRYAVWSGKRINHTYTFEEPVQSVGLTLYHGDLNVQRSQTDDFKMEVVYRTTLFGDDVTTADIEEFVTVEVVDGNLTFTVHNQEVQANLTLYVPATGLQKLAFEAKNGDVSVVDVEIDELKVDTRGGDIDLENVTIQLLEVNTTSGDVVCYDCTLNEVKAELVSGDFVARGNLGNTQVNAVSGDLVITKYDSETATIRATTTSGDIKVAVPILMSLEAEAQAGSVGDVAHRYHNVDSEVREGKKMLVKRQVADANQVNIVATTTAGDIRLKDTDK